MQRGAEGFGEGAEEVRHQLRGHVADAFAVEFALPEKVGAAGNVQSHLSLRLVHGEQESITSDTALVAECLAQRGAQGEGDIFDRVMFVDM